MSTSSPDGISPGRVGRLVGRAVVRRLSSVAPHGRLAGAEEASARLGEAVRSAAGQRIFLYYWIEDALPLMLYACRGDAVVGSGIRFVCDDTLGGRITADVVARLGWEHLPLRLRHQAKRVRDVQRLILERSMVGIAIDGRGPYRRVGPEFARLLRRCEAWALPLSVRVDRFWSLPGQPIRLPRRGASLAVEIGEPVRASGAVVEGTERLQRALDATVRAADARLEASGLGPDGES